MKVSAQYAEEHFADILGKAKSGEDIEISTPDESSFRLTLVKAGPTTPRRPRRELLGAWEGLVKAPTQEEWDAIHEQFLSEMPDFSSKVNGEPT
jgi:antitoxin (DNA-binding transcriptional repressor) of toxin-antitoxin stability system